MALNLIQNDSVKCGSAIYALTALDDSVYFGLGSGAIGKWKPAGRIPPVGISIGKSPIFGLSATGQSVASLAQDGEIVLRDAGSLEILFHAQTDMPCHSIALTPYFLFAGAGNHGIRKFDLSGQTAPQDILSRKINARAIAVDDELIFTGWGDGAVIQMDFFGENPTHHTPHQGTVFTVAKTGDYLISGGKDAVLKVHSAGGKLLKEQAAHLGTINSVAVLDDGLMATASRDKSLKIWTLPDLRLLAKAIPAVNERSHSQNAVCWLSGAQMLISGGDDGVLRSWTLLWD